MRPSLFLLFFVVALFPKLTLLAQQTSTTTTTSTQTSDPQAVAVVQAAITALGGASAIKPLQSWTFQAQAQGRLANGNVSEVLASAIPPTSKTLPTVPNAPHYARPRSLFVPALVSAILLNESQDTNVLLKQAATASAISNLATVAFSVVTKSGAVVPIQRWYFSATTNLPMTIDFFTPARIGPTEVFPGIVTLSNYQTVAGVQYPFQIVTVLRRENVAETITLQSVAPSTSLPSATNASSGGAQ